MKHGKKLARSDTLNHNAVRSLTGRCMKVPWPEAATPLGFVQSLCGEKLKNATLKFFEICAVDAGDEDAHFPGPPMPHATSLMTTWMRSEAGARSLPDRSDNGTRRYPIGR